MAFNGWKMYLMHTLFRLALNIVDPIPRKEVVGEDPGEKSGSSAEEEGGKYAPTKEEAERLMKTRKQLESWFPY